MFKLIETHYFKQTIIDYLTIILGSVIWKGESTRKPKNKQTNPRNLSSDTSSQSSISSENNSQNTQMEDVEIGYEDILSCFKTRMDEAEATRIANLFESKIKANCKEDIRYVYQTLRNKQPITHRVTQRISQRATQRISQRTNQRMSQTVSHDHLWKAR